MSLSKRTKEKVLSDLTYLCQQSAGKNLPENRDSKERFREERDLCVTLLRASSAFYVAISAEGKTIMMNKAFLEALGYTAEEVIGKDYLTTFVPEGDRDGLAKVFEAIVQRGEPTLSENRVLTKDGRELLVEWRGRPVLKETGELDFYFGVGIDVTERKRAEEALKISEQKYRALVESSSDAILMVDEKRRIVSSNRAFLELFGFEREEIEGKSMRILLDSDETFQSFGETFYPVIEKEGSIRTEWELMHKNGTIIPVEETLSAIREEDGATRGYVAIIRDITERKLAEEKLKRYQDHLEELVRERTADLVESEEKYRTLVENVPLVVYRMKPGGEILFVNHFVEEVLGFSSLEIVRNPELWSSRVYDEDRQSVEEFRKKSFLEGTEFIAEYRVRHRDGRMVYVMDHAIPFRDYEGGLTSIDGIIVDVTGRVKLQEKLLRAEGLKTISEVSARLAHEIRNPLVSAGGFARRLLSSMREDDPNRAKVEIILKEVGRLEMILRMILSYLQPIEISKAPTDPYRLIEAALRSVSEELRERNVDLDLRLLSDVKEISLDPVQMEQAIGVLIRCALSHMRKGGTLSLSATSNGDLLKIAMRYPVEHMAQDDVKHFFYPFALCRMASEVIDLPMSKIIIEEHGGTIDVMLDSSKELHLELSLPFMP